ncbi:beta-galactosidase 11-like [Canna indica]|uniref:Beta-galactosidase n=1 Tax=Canna indica TaxID=4628 RepID=A0AAQ3QRC0_9LILI|nr:beta-galactosidase 11-like [Canna indica]
MYSETAASRALVVLLLVIATLAGTHAHAHGDSNGTFYDGRSLKINGKRELFFSGSIHYPRSTPEMWPDLIRKAKEGGLNTIETYVFWNIHEPVYGQFNFEGRYDLVKFLKLVKEQDMFAVVRFGPFVQGEWNHGGLPYWLREVANITFRTYNEPFMFHMERFARMFVQKLKDEKLFITQGGPIVLAQIENEYNNIARAFAEGHKYIMWAADLALRLDAEVPWVMCKQDDAPGPVINSCNGRNCGDTFKGPNSPTKPYLWTENWTAQYRVFGDPPSQRAAEDLSYAVARFFAKKGTLVNYYMYHGGTNFGRTGAAFVMTRYYDEAPLDEYGLKKEPKWGHLKELHAALRLCRKGLLWGTPSHKNYGNGFEVRLFESSESSTCVAFLVNTNAKLNGTVNFRGVDYFLPRKSISILPDCKTVIYNTQMVNSQHNARTYVVSDVTNKKNQWQMYQENIPTSKQATIKSKGPLELYNMTKDTTDYLWYTTSFKLDAEDLPFRNDIRPVIQVSTLGHVVHTFVNGEYVGSAHGTKLEKSFVCQKPVNLKVGTNKIAVLALTVGMPDSGAFLEHRLAGLHTVGIQGLNAGTLDLSQSLWRHQVGLTGEKLGIFQEPRLDAVKWTEAKSGTPIAWYKRYFDAPSGNDPVALDLSSMTKGQVWINGEAIGRYWVSYLNPLGNPSQSAYHVPRSFLKKKDNLMVVFDEEGGKVEDIKITTVKRDNICAIVSDQHPARVGSWLRENNQIRSVGNNMKPEAQLECDSDKVIRSIVFASFGNPGGACGNFTVGNCHTPKIKSVVEKACLGKQSCVLPVSAKAYDADAACPGTLNTLAVQAKCSKKGKKEKA